jgi:hypothetical protein
MLLSTLALAALAAPAAALPVENEAANGPISWYEGTYDELMADAVKADKLVFLEFWRET